MQAGQNDGPAGRANGIRDESVAKKHALVRKPVQIGRGVQRGQGPSVGAERLRRMVVRKDENDIGTFVPLGKNGRGRRQETKEQNSK